MTRDEFKAKLDVDHNGKVDFEDVIKFVDGSDRKLFALGAAVGAAVGIIVGAVIF